MSLKENLNSNTKRKNKFSVALNGLICVFKEESSFKYQFVLFILTIILGFICKLNFIEWVLVVLMATLVFTFEILNTAIENTIDLVSPEYNELAGKVKDISAGAVLVCAMGAVIIGILIFIPKIFKIGEVLL